MKNRTSSMLIFTFSLLLGASSAFAEKGGKHGRGNDDRQEMEYSQRTSIQINFGDSDRREISNYYGSQISSGKCPPGLAKKGNGCQPPGQAKKWTKGRPLPRDVVYYDLPRDLTIRLPIPPAGHRYVRVASDILLIAVGTSMVVDAIQDIVR
jgi:Ni/Co efflux regulator RcnB